MARCDKGSWQCFGHKMIHINLPFSRSRKLQDEGIVGWRRNLTYNFFTGTYWMSINDYNIDSVEDASFRSRSVKMLKLYSCLDERKRLQHMKLACSAVFVCFNYSTSLCNDDSSSFKSLTMEARLARLHAWWRIDSELCQGIVTKKRIVIWTMFGHKAIHINLSFTRSRKSKDVEIVEAEI